MQAAGGIHLSLSPRQSLKEKKVGELIKDGKRLIEVPYTASIADTVNALIANGISAVPVSAQPGHWIGAGGSMILESDEQTGVARKHYIGMITMLDVLAHIADEEAGDMERKMHVQISTIIGHCNESLSLWTMSCNTSIPDCMEVFSTGIHRALVPVESHVENISAVELTESAPSYRMLTQMDLLKFLKAHKSDLKGVMSRHVGDVGVVGDTVFGLTNKTQVIDVIKCMNSASLNAVPIIESKDDDETEHGQLVNGKNRKLVASFSIADLRGCPISQLQSCFNMSTVDFIEKCSVTPHHHASGLRTSTRELVTSLRESTLGELVDKCVDNHVHRVWVVKRVGLLAGLITPTDVIRTFRGFMLSGYG